MTTPHVDNPISAAQTGEAMQFVADLRDIATGEPECRRLADPWEAASVMERETLSRVDAVLQSFAGTPVILLSGGVDSILVAAAAVALGARPHAVTVSSGGTDRANAAAVAAALGLSHETVELSEQAVAELAGEAVARLGSAELWEVSYAIPLLATLPVLDRLGSVGPILTGNGADAIVAGGATMHHPLDSLAARDELDRIVRTESARNFVRDRLVPDFYPRIMGSYANRVVHIFQTVRFWEAVNTFAPPALFGEHNGEPVDKLCVRICCARLLSCEVESLAWSKKAAIQKSAGIMGSLAAAARSYVASLPGARTYADPMTEPQESVTARLFLASLGHTHQPERTDENRVARAA